MLGVTRQITNEFVIADLGAVRFAQFGETVTNGSATVQFGYKLWESKHGK